MIAKAAELAEVSLVEVLVSDVEVASAESVTPAAAATATTTPISPCRHSR